MNDALVKLKGVLSKGAPNFSAKNENGETLLHLAAAAGDVDTLKYVFSKTQFPNTRNDSYFTPLETAIIHGHEEAALFLLENGVKTDASPRTNGAIHLAVRGGMKEVVAMLLKRDESLANAKGFFQNVPLHYAAERLDAEMIELLMKHGASPNTVNEVGHNAFHHAVAGVTKNEDAELLPLVTGMLKSYGCNPDAGVRFGDYPACRACMNKFVGKHVETVVGLALPTGRGVGEKNFLLLSAQNENPYAVKIGLEFGLSPDETLSVFSSDMKMERKTVRDVAPETVAAAEAMLSSNVRRLNSRRYVR